MNVISYTSTEPSAPSDYYNHHNNSSDDDDLYQYSSDDEFDHNDDPSIPPPAPPLPVPGSSSYLALFSTEKHRISSLGTTSTASSRSFLSAASSTVPSPNTTNDDEEEEEHRHQPPTTTTTQDDRSCLRSPWKYASKKNQQKMRIGRTTSKNKKNKAVAFDDDDAVGSDGVFDEGHPGSIEVPHVADIDNRTKSLGAAASRALIPRQAIERKGADTRLRAVPF